jgi:hypothetical protein
MLRISCCWHVHIYMRHHYCIQKVMIRVHFYPPDWHAQRYRKLTLGVAKCHRSYSAVMCSVGERNGDTGGDCRGESNPSRLRFEQSFSCLCCACASTTLSVCNILRTPVGACTGHLPSAKCHVFVIDTKSSTPFFSRVSALLLSCHLRDAVKRISEIAC